MMAWRPHVVKKPVTDHLCPFCGSPDIYIGRPGGAFAVQCGFCGARGSVRKSRAEAIDWWEGE